MAKIQEPFRCAVCNAKIRSGRLCHDCETAVKTKTEKLIPLNSLKLLYR